jgi:hypothetical protein
MWSPMTSPKPPVWAITRGFATALCRVYHHGLREGADVTDVLDMPLHDHELLAEIAMTSELMIAAAEAEGPIPQRAIDAVLQVSAA